MIGVKPLGLSQSGDTNDLATRLDHGASRLPNCGPGRENVVDDDEAASGERAGSMERSALISAARFASEPDLITDHPVLSQHATRPQRRPFQQEIDGVVAPTPPGSARGRNRHQFDSGAAGDGGVNRRPESFAECLGQRRGDIGAPSLLVRADHPAHDPVIVQGRPHSDAVAVGTLDRWKECGTAVSAERSIGRFAARATRRQQYSPRVTQR